MLHISYFSQNVVNDARSRWSISAEKKLNNKLSLSAKLQVRQTENLLLLNRVYLQCAAEYNLTENFSIGISGNYITSRGGFWAMSNSFRYAGFASYKTKLTDRFSLINKLSYQTSTNNITNSEFEKIKSSTVLRNKSTLKYKYNRRGTFYISEELMWQVFGKPEKYFSRNRLYLGYSHKINSKLDLEPYFILERTFNRTGGPQERNFYYCVNLNYSF